MIGNGSEAHVWDHEPHADHAAPTLAMAPKGLSARRVERWLGLPPGAWQRRRLYALRLTGQAFLHLGLQRGDMIIVEPGRGEQPGRLAVRRGPHGMSLQKIADPIDAERRMPTVLELPLRERSVQPGGHVVGIVIGILRATGTGALRPVALSARRFPGRHRSGRRSTAAPGSATTRRPGLLSPDELSTVRQQWRSWLADAQAETSLAPGQIERWGRLDASLTTFCECLARTHSPELRDALTAEAARVVAAIHREMGG